MTTPGSYGDAPVRNAVPFGDLDGPALRGDRDARRAAHARADRAAASTSTSALLGALTALARDGAVGHDGARRDRDADRQRRCRGWRRSGSSRRTTATSRSVRRPMPSRAASSRRSAGPSSPTTSGSRRATGGCANAAELHGVIERWAAPRSTRGGDGRARGARRARRRRPRHGEGRPRPAGRSARGETTCSSPTRARAGRRAVRQRLPDPVLRRRGPATSAVARLGEHNEFVLGGLLGYTPSGSRRFAPPALSKAPGPRPSETRLGAVTASARVQYQGT